MAQRIFQDPAGTIPAILPGQPVGLVKRMAGTVDATQATALSKPTLARWPMNGRRNLATGAQAVGNATYWPVSTVGGVTRTLVGSGVEDGLPYADFRVSGTPTATFVYLYDPANASVPLVVGETFSSRVEARVISGSIPSAQGLRCSVREGTIRGSGTVSTTSGTPLASSDYGVSSLSRVLTGVGGATWVFSTLTIVLEVGVAVDVTYRVKGLQFERGAVQTPLQFNYGPNDITEPGVKDLWHLYNDGGDSLTIIIPAGTYGVANLAIDRSYRIENIDFDDGGTITTLLGERQIDCIYRRGGWSPAEQLAIQQYWEKEYPL